MSAPVITLIGGPTALIEASGFRLLTDPTFDAPGEYKLPHVTLKKLAGPARTAAEVGPVDAVLLSHDQHADNFDRSGKAYAIAAPHPIHDVCRRPTARHSRRRVGAVAKHKHQQAGRGDIAINRNSGAARPARHRTFIRRRDWLRGELFRRHAAALRHQRHGLVRRRGRGGAPLSSRCGPRLRRLGPPSGCSLMPPPMNG